MSNKNCDNLKNALRKHKQELLRKQKKRIANLATYTRACLHNAPTPASRKPPKKVTANSIHYTESRTPNRIYFPDPDGGEPIDSGMTVGEYLKKIKGGYRAKGAGSFQKEKVQTRVKGSNPPGTYAEKNQQPGKFFTKGTGKFSTKEREKIAKQKRQLAEYREKLEKADADKAARLELEVESIERQLAAGITSGMTKRKAGALSRKQAKRKEKLQQLAARREEKFRKREEKKRLYRIVKPTGRGWEDKPARNTLLRRGAAPGKVPKTWRGGGLREKFLARNWVVEKISDYQTEVKIRPAPNSEGTLIQDNAFLRRLEFGGWATTKPIVKGYLVFFRDGLEDKQGRKQKFSHRRIAFLPLKTEPKRVHVKPRPFVRPTLMKVDKEFRQRNGRIS